MDISDAELARAKAVMAKVRQFIIEGKVIRLPAFDPSRHSSSDTALLSIPLDGNDFSGRLGAYCYQFEGEDDLLHFFVTRSDGLEIGVGEARKVVNLVMPNAPPGLIWLRPGRLSQHFYIGHDDLLAQTDQQS